ncbi:hypothetical protein WFZ85_10625 [Flavobacterium sp. j3]|uniref:Uncharacterized protein n=1 Tax=Flavobacterium aureirubrum TaxID=3133147 RepID=A0ABU9N5T2_9FLAO
MKKLYLLFLLIGISCVGQQELPISETYLYNETYWELQPRNVLMKSITATEDGIFFYNCQK